MSNRIIFIFLDGVGVGKTVKSNPFISADMPFLTGIVNGPLCMENQIIREDLIFKGIDAQLNIKGLPQSATGQTALLTGINAPAQLGFHFPAFPNETLIDIIKKHNIFTRLKSINRNPCFANAYTKEYFELVEEGKREHSVTTHCLLASRTPFKTVSDLIAGKAVYWDITNKHLNDRIYKNELYKSIKLITPIEAGKNLATLAGEYDFTLFESFLPDKLGHKGRPEEITGFLQMIDSFIQSVAHSMNSDCTLIISSDHGNIEDISAPGHTYNPAIFIALGPGCQAFKSVENITEIAEPVLELLK